MRALLLCAVLLGACRPSDGGSQTTPAQTGGAAAATAGAPGDSDRSNALLERADQGRIQGDSAAPVWIVEISDFQCPFCKKWHDETYPIIKREYVDQGIVRMAYVNLPLTSIHPHADPAAEAAMCASAQGKFWPVHDAIFSTQDRWSKLDDARALFDSLALATGIDAAQYRSCMDSRIMVRLINGDRERAAGAGVRSTPVFFVGGEGIQGAAPVDAFRAAIARARARAMVRPKQ